MEDHEEVKDGGAWDKRHPEVYSGYKDPEKIAASAIWYMTEVTHNLRPYNVDRGLVIVGLHHANCIDLYHTLTGKRTVGSEVHRQGFLTTHNRFVDRDEAYKIALNAGQIEDDGDRAWLLSEYLFCK